MRVLVHWDAVVVSISMVRGICMVVSNIVAIRRRCEITSMDFF